MKRGINFCAGNITSLALVAGLIFAFISLIGVVNLDDPASSEISFNINPNKELLAVGEVFETDIIVNSHMPVNVFAGELVFDHNLLHVDSIDYNNSIADLWAELPWFSNGERRITFAGGTTRPGGFVGSDNLIKVTFRTIAEGTGTMSIINPRILLHDGLGTDAEVAKSTNALFSVGGQPENLSQASTAPASYTVAKDAPTTDLNGDGKQSMADISIFMLNLAGDDRRFDFDLDGKVGIKDLNILLGKK